MNLCTNDGIHATEFVECMVNISDIKPSISQNPYQISIKYHVAFPINMVLSERTTKQFPELLTAFDESVNFAFFVV